MISETILVMRTSFLIKDKISNLLGPLFFSKIYKSLQTWPKLWWSIIAKGTGEVEQ